VWTVGFYDRSFGGEFDEEPRRRYEGHGSFDVVAICYDSRSPRMDLELVSTKWLPEIYHFLPKIPIVLVEVDGGGVSSEEGGRVASQIGISFVKCPRGSSENAITALARAAFKHKVKREARASGHWCSVRSRLSSIFRAPDVNNRL